jgi:hypothetical protein
MLQSLILIDAFSSACWEKKKREVARVFFPQDWTHIAGCATQDFCGFKVQLKADFMCN